MQFTSTFSFLRRFSTTPLKFANVVVCGASGGIGQPLSLLLKSSPLVSKLALYDLDHAVGVAEDVSHVNTKAKVSGFNEPDRFVESMKNAQVVVVAAGVPRKPGMTRGDLLKVNADVIKNVICYYTEAKSRAFIAIITNPLNTLTPYAAELLKKACLYNPKKLFGVTTLDIVRASTFVGELKNLDPQAVEVHVIGGHSGNTMVPLLCKTKPSCKFTQEELCSLTSKIQNAGTVVVDAKKGKGSATLSMAYAAARFTFALCRAFKGEKDVVECAYVDSNLTEVKFFASPLKIGKDGVTQNLGFGELSEYEEMLLQKAIPELRKEVQLGVDLAAGGKK